MYKVIETTKTKIDGQEDKIVSETFHFVDKNEALRFFDFCILDNEDEVDTEVFVQLFDVYDNLEEGEEEVKVIPDKLIKEHNEIL